jgi:hypothetical protein
MSILENRVGPRWPRTALFQVGQLNFFNQAFSQACAVYSIPSLVKLHITSSPNVQIQAARRFYVGRQLCPRREGRSRGPDRQLRSCVPTTLHLQCPQFGAYALGRVFEAVERRITGGNECVRSHIASIDLHWTVMLTIVP